MSAFGKLFIAVMIAIAPPARAADPASSEPARSVETQDRQADSAALATRLDAIETLTTSLRKFRNTPREPTLLWYLAQAEQESAELQYRLAFGTTRKTNGPDLSEYEKNLKQVIAATSRLLEKYPRFEETDAAYLLRANAYAALRYEDPAQADYRELIRRFPGSPGNTPARLALADYAMKRGEHRQAIDYLAKIESQPDDPRLPFALYQLAWCYFNLEDFPRALGYLERHIDFYNRLEQANGAAFPSSDTALRERSALDVPLFFVEGLVKDRPGFELAQALPTFRRMQVPRALGKMALRLAKLLRVRDRQDDLLTWKEAVLQDLHDEEQALDVLMTTFEYLANKRAYEKLATVAADFPRLAKASGGKMRQFESYPAAGQLILRLASQLQRDLSARHDEKLTARIGPALAALYRSFVDITDEKVGSVALAHYNLGETLFNLGQYDLSVEHYQWVLDHWAESFQQPRASVMLKRIGAGYRSLTQQGIIPATLAPTPLRGDEKLDRGKLDKRLRRWMDWLAEYRQTPGAQESAIAQFEFEADRACYAEGQTRAVVNRLSDRIEKGPVADYGEAAASLVLDTYVLSEDWDRVNELSARFGKIAALADGAFAEKLAAVGADAFYKRFEETVRGSDPANSARLADEFLRKYPDHPRAADCLLLASQASMKQGRDAEAKRYLSTLLSRFPRSEHRRSALLLRAELEEKDYAFESAADDYQQSLLAGSPRKDDERSEDWVRKRLYTLRWLAKDAPTAALDCTPAELPPDVRGECLQYQSLIALRSDKARESVKAPPSASDETTQTLWTLVTLRNSKRIPFGNRQQAIRRLAAGWLHLDPLLKAATLPDLLPTLLDSFALGRRELGQEGRLRPQTVSTRADRLREIEKTAQALLTLPWVDLRVRVLSELAEAYRVFAQDVRKLASVKGLRPEQAAEIQKSVDEISAPLAAKGTRLHEEARDAAADAGVRLAGLPGFETEPAREIAEALVPIAPPMLLKMEKDFAPSSWAQGKAAQALQALWIDALLTKAWGRAAFFLRELEVKTEPDSATLGVMRAIALASAGAPADALADLAEQRRHFNRRGKNYLDHVLYSHYARSPAAKQAEKIRSEIDEYEKERGS